jgi:hypothetical protein
VELISHVQERLVHLLDVGGIRLADGTALAVASYAGCEKRSLFSGLARYGYAKSEHRFIWGVRLILLTDERGLPLGHTVVPANEHEREPLADLLAGTSAEVVVADKGLWRESFKNRLLADGARLLTPNKTRTSTNLVFERALASTRLVIESVLPQGYGCEPLPTETHDGFSLQGNRHDQQLPVTPCVSLRLIASCEKVPGGAG